MAADFWVAYAERLGIVAIVLFALYVIGRKLRTTKLLGGGRRIQLLESAPVSPHALIHVVRVGARYFLLGTCAGGVIRLAELRRADTEDGYTLK